jgi:hypothetical protein
MKTYSLTIVSSPSFIEFAAESPYFPKESLVAKQVSEENEIATKPL